MCLQYNSEQGACGHDIPKKVTVLCDDAWDKRKCKGVVDMGGIPSAGTDQYLKDCAACQSMLIREVYIMIQASKRFHPESANLQSLEHMYQSITSLKRIHVRQKRGLLRKVLKQWIETAEVYQPVEEYGWFCHRTSQIGGPIKSWGGTAESYFNAYQIPFPGYCVKKPA